MLPKKIKMTEELKNHIHKARINKPITAAALSLKIGRTESYISTLETDRLQTLSADDLVAIIMYLHNVTMNEAVAIIEPMLNPNIEKPENTTVSDIVLHENNNEVDEYARITGRPIDEFFKEFYINEEYRNDLIDKTLNEISDCFRTEFDDRPIETLFIMKNFLESLRSAPSTVMSILRIPFSDLTSFTYKTLDSSSEDIIDKLVKYTESGREPSPTKFVDKIKKVDYPKTPRR